jgi:histidinol-phosphate aminotransferase
MKKSPRSASPYIRPLVRDLHAYVPGEQPRIRGLIKLNTNENAFPPSPKVLKAIREAVDERLRLYPHPTSQPLREALAKFHGCAPENIFVGNGSDEVLALTTRIFVEPLEANASEHRSLVQFFTPSYSLYPVLADIHGAGKNPVPLNDDFSIPAGKNLTEAGWNGRAALSLITTPNAPSGRGYTTEQLEEICRAQKGIVLLDETYADFADENAAELALKYSNVVVSRTFSKAYSLCFQRVGYGIAAAELIEAFDKVRDSYNVNGLGQIAALATLNDLPYYQKNFSKIVETRDWFGAQLQDLGFDVLPSQTNFLLVVPVKLPAQQWLERLREEKILVRWFSSAKISKYLRISIGTREEMEKVLRAIRKILVAKR